ncbi:hypothetical protein TVAG_013850 [Trichomonas vaginalis G3]|uniref:Uncharacterized protein n=1 Tax=Trichomonas vaginalis (strain ATCC PRA-98 / G3) TaxID=412133 RepID=A2DDE0_TRIV3|nr:hypothetical protein TVAGG3_0986460 [Trichomonas vaginalis G3]EAY21619.1 hypothetical protein TVAG_013850 [Trichomonas vaginalis G3]KAI5489705.1 hypothetical protein TVAGG3_0986460 [Trichomonas vaginalis G3]|eukprot:XP_001582605.1 hypothetical protein [Trichomonas vaginalis G3]
MDVDIKALVDSERYKATVEEIADAIDSQIQGVPFVQPQLCTFIDDETAKKLLEKETNANNEQWEVLENIYHEIIEDVLLAEIELQQLDIKKDELWKVFSKSAYAKLIDKYEVSMHEEATFIANMKNKITEKSNLAIDDACRQVEVSNRKFKKESKALTAQLSKLELELDEERDHQEDYSEEESEDIDLDNEIENVRAEVADLTEQRDQLDNECEDLKKEIEQLMQDFVALDSRSVGANMQKRKTHKK